MVQELSAAGEIPQVPTALDTGLPLDLLRRRPDINEAERQLAGATARIGVATANLFPHLAITGGAGFQGQGLGVTPVMKSFIWSAGPSLMLPILDFGTLDAMVNIADLHTHAMLMNYKQTVLGAVQQVDSAASAYNAQQDRLNNLRSALDASQQSVSLATQRFDRGLIDSLNVIDAQRQEFQLEQDYVAAQQTAADQYVALYKAMGGGWEAYQKLPAIKRPLPAVIAALVRSVQADQAKADEVAQGMPPH
jgi:outer membrane protein TolC